ncbi:hypothetical protein BTO04_05980 [Polaribacter sp. SA4-10]|uniref:DUF6122 family protein n=1 Tax=Polaribacter sp. SA4-10 TaxID=754397 RepID=UPI000B54EBBC|nr:DUF6122 family protein [Polaribacter sp. SA4-10]ARV06275.1 hypothetical protein BTO04_05980 [Polaribacter sp. SA4-10]
MILKFFMHYGLHFLFPGVIAYMFFKEKWKVVYLLFIATMLVDLDHLIATPIFDSNRCSVGFHILHSYIAIGIYSICTLFKTTRVMAIGLLFHMFTDYIDCYL